MSKEQSTRMFNAFDPGTTTIQWVNGAGLVIAKLDLMKVPGAAEAIVQFGPESLPAVAMIHGFTQKVGDAAALGIENGRRPTWDDKARAMREVIEALYNGAWNAKREAGGMLRAALERLAAKGSKKAAEYLAGFVGMDDDTKKALSKSKLVIDTINQIRAERANPADDLINDL